MDQNPLSDIIVKVKEYKLETELAEIKASIQSIKEKQSMPKLLKLTTTDDITILVNPDHIVSVVPATSQQVFVNLVDNVQYRVDGTPEDIMKLITDDSSKSNVPKTDKPTYIG